jgi:hypothetical protein
VLFHDGLKEMLAGWLGVLPFASLALIFHTYQLVV